MHDHGIPERDAWPDGVIEAVGKFRQGDLVARLPLFWWADPARAIHARTVHYRAQQVSDETVVRTAEVAPYGLITTQTCGLAQEGNGKPNSAWVQMCPVFDAESPHPVLAGKNLLDGGARKLLKEGRDQRRLWVPDIPGGGVWFADLTFEVPVERGWLASRERIVGFVGESEREEVGRRLAWLRSRPAFDSRFVEAVQQPIIAALRNLSKDDKAAYEQMHNEVHEIGIRMDGRLQVGQAELAILHHGIGEDSADWWRELWVSLKSNADEQGFNLLPMRVVHLDELSAAEYRRMTTLPLVNISPHSILYGMSPSDLPSPG